MGPEFNNYLIVENIQIGMVTFGFCDFSNLINKRHCLNEVTELTFALQMRGIGRRGRHHHPSGINLILEFANSRSFKRRRSPLARDTFLLSKHVHSGKKNAPSGAFFTHYNLLRLLDFLTIAGFRHFLANCTYVAYDAATIAIRTLLIPFHISIRSILTRGDTDRMRSRSNPPWLI